MKLMKIGNNETEIMNANGDTVFFSYSTPVAANVDGAFYRTEKHHSVTTSKHINKWLDGRKAEYKPQEFFDALV